VGETETAVKLGLVTPLGYGIAPSELVSLAVAAEAAGLGSIQVGELAGTEVFSLVSAMVAATSTIRIETAIVSTLTRSPALLAMAAATLAELSDGRFVLGLGAGSPIVASWHGKQFYDRPRSEVVAVIEQVRTLLAGERLAAAGGFRLTGLAPRPEVPIYVSALNDRMIQAAGQYADGVILNMAGPAQAARMAALARRARAGAGIARPFEFVVNLWAYAGDDIESAQARLRWETAPYAAVPTYRPAMIAIAGAAGIDAVADAWRAGGRSAAAPLLPAEFVDTVLVCGGAAEFAERVEQYRQAGVDTVHLVPLTARDGDAASARSVIDTLGQLGRAPLGSTA
jgi:alkanesulfonate monooxygenase SsuD/methylene tetrahydromethanopterin reductase-like flavin-dependent oxidoreductase (luciferase family)